MKMMILTLAMLISGGAFAAQTCGGRSGPCPSNLPGWDGNYAPGYGPGTPNYEYNNTPRQPACGGRLGPCPSTAPEYTGGCVEGYIATITYSTGRLIGRSWEMKSEQVICHNNQWYPAN